MGIIFSKISTDPDRNLADYEIHLRKEFSGFHIKILQDQTTLFGVASRHQDHLDICLHHSDQHNITVCADGIPLLTAEKILEVYVQHGDNCFEHLEDDLTCIIYDHTHHRVIAGRDRMGIRPLFYNTTPEHIILSSHLGGVLSGMNKNKYNERVVKERLLSSFTWGCEPHFETLYEDVMKLGQGRYLTWHTGHLEEFRYWRLDSYEGPTPSLKTAIKEFKQLLQNAVTKYMDFYPSAVVEVSGGLDSGAIAAYAARYAPNTCLLAVSNKMPKTLPKEFLFTTKNNEFHFAQTICDHLNIELSAISEESYTEGLSRIPELIKWMKGSIPHSFSILHYPFYEYGYSKNALGIFSGFGGDEFTSTHGIRIFSELKESKSYIKYTYERYMKLTFFDLLQKIKSRFKQTSNESKPVFFNKFSNKKLAEFFSPSWLSWIQSHQQERLINQNQKNNESEYYEGEYSNGFHGRLETSYWGSRYFGTTYHFPLLDWKLVSYFHHLPTHYKHRHGKGRYLFYKALHKYLPKDILFRKTKNTSTIPSAVNIMMKLESDVFKEDTILNPVISRNLNQKRIQAIIDCNGHTIQSMRLRGACYFMTP